jgi:hypothetical protein
MRVPQRREPAADVGAGTRLDGATRSLLGQADTAFVATRAPEHGADVAHRGGNPGFLRVVDDTTIVWPAYRGTRCSTRSAISSWIRPAA